MPALRHTLLAVVLLVAQLVASVHAVEHAAGNKEVLVTHACELCLAAHDLGAALPALAAPLPVQCSFLAPDAEPADGRSALPPPIACQRGPPARP